MSETPRHIHCVKPEHTGARVTVRLQPEDHWLSIPRPKTSRQLLTSGYFLPWPKRRASKSALAAVCGSSSLDFRRVQGHFFKTKEIQLWNFSTVQWMF